MLNDLKETALVVAALMKLDDDKFVDRCYRVLLNRSPDTTGYNYYLGRLRSGFSKKSIIKDIATNKQEPSKLKKIKIALFLGKACCNHGAIMKYEASIAVIIPFYNGMNFLWRALESVKNQTMQPKEVIVVDDGSENDESSACRRLVENFGYIYVKKINGGQGSARNYGVKISSAEFVCFLDQDDYYLPEHNELLFSEILLDKFGFVYGDVAEGDEQGCIVRSGMVKEHSDHPKTSLFECLRRDMFILPGAVMINRVAFLSVNGFDERLRGYEDDDLFLRMFREGYKNSFLNKTVSVWCINEGSTSYTIKMGRSRMIYFAKLLADYPEKKFLSINYPKDLVIPRFLPWFITDALKGVILDNEYAHEYVSILSDVIDLSQPFLSEEETARLRTILSWCLAGRNVLVNSLYFSRLAENWGFIQTFYDK